MTANNEPSEQEPGIFSAPIFGGLIRAVFQGGDAKIYAILLAIVVLWVLVVATFGYAAFIITMLASVLGMFVTLIVITLGS